ncbi:ferrous iron transport protein B [Desulfobaculum bizertense]|uniref:Ferrous iron transport protein B n=1 Tax=Desulfobaculum bizertense DSM 18034 TaxID=1121442 RepID=A0A1T4VGF1_9BACT|nr:ferrous iron transport protein B [Desulfobaculum bizertense]SKA64027.1 ferrous iron transport protein B [Desulfobaculum bizertense DSM 18034]
MAERISMALAGNPNAGKTTLFNAITGARQHVGNYPGITVEKKEGRATINGYDFHIIDLPGTYSLTAYTQEEIVSRNVLVDERPDVVVDVLNASAIERNLYLAVQIMEMGIPVVLALNMMDEARSHGMSIDVPELSKRLGMPVVETVGRTGEGVPELLTQTADFAVENRGKNEPLNISYGPDLDPVLREMTELIESAHFMGDRYPARWLALKYLENDEEILANGNAADSDFSTRLLHLSADVADHCQKTLNTYPEAIIADYRYGFITSLLKHGVLERRTDQARVDLSDRLDHVLTHRFMGPIGMVLVLLAVYKVTFTVGEIPMGWMESLFGWMGDMATAIIPDGLLRSMVVSGIIDGVGGVLSFVPLILLIFLFISFLEDSGYMARIAYMLDRVFRVFGLHGCSVMPFIVSGGIAGGCAVPGVMAARTLRSRREKLATLLTAPFMTCGAKLPVFILLIGVFFPEHQAPALFAITMLGWAAALFVSKLLRSTVIKGPSTPFVMELPPYRFPTVRGMLIHTWERTWQYIKKAGTVILAISVLLWALMTFPGPSAEQHAAFDAKLESGIAEIQQTVPAAEQDKAIASLTAQIESERGETRLRNSFAGRIGTGVEGISQLSGFDWRTNIALIGGVAAKEIIISTLGTAYSLGGDADTESSLASRLKSNPDWNPLRAVALIVFILLYSPCFVTLVAIRGEAGSWKWAMFSLFFNTAFAFALSTLVYQGGKALGLG